VTVVEGRPPVPPGALIDVTMSGVTDDGDFTGSLAGIASLPGPAARGARSLPVASTIGSYGR
jgi:hypothetical protein